MDIPIGSRPTAGPRSNPVGWRPRTTAIHLSTAASPVAEDAEPANEGVPKDCVNRGRICPSVRDRPPGHGLIPSDGGRGPRQSINPPTPSRGRGREARPTNARKKIASTGADMPSVRARPPGHGLVPSEVGRGPRKFINPPPRVQWGRSPGLANECVPNDCAHRGRTCPARGRAQPRISVASHRERAI